MYICMYCRDVNRRYFAIMVMVMTNVVGYRLKLIEWKCSRVPMVASEGLDVSAGGA